MVWPLLMCDDGGERLTENNLLRGNVLAVGALDTLSMVCAINVWSFPLAMMYSHGLFQN